MKTYSKKNRKGSTLNVRGQRQNLNSLGEEIDLTEEISFRISSLDSLLGANIICVLCSSPIEIS